MTQAAPAPVPEDLRRVMRLLALRASRARADVSEFFSFVMREEVQDPPPLIVAPHQRLRFEFVEAHPLCVIRTPRKTSKTFDLQAAFLWHLGIDPSIRMALVSSKQAQAATVVQNVAKYIETNPRLRSVFPHLKRSNRIADPWQYGKITVQRGGDIRDPSLVAIGYQEGIPGKRLDRINVDDILTSENTATFEQRKKVIAWFFSTLLPTKGNVLGFQCCVSNVPWHSGIESKSSGGAMDDAGDLTFALSRQGWAVMNQDITGNIWFENTDWDSPLIRPSERNDPAPTGDGLMHRLVEHDTPAYARLCGVSVPADVTEWVDHDNQVPLWPEQTPWSEIENLRNTTLDPFFQQNYMMRVRSDKTSIVKEAWIEACKTAASIWTPPIRSLFVGKWNEPFPTITGVDTAYSKKSTADQSAIFTFCVYPNGYRRILNITFGHWSGNELMNRVVGEASRFNSIVYIEEQAGGVFIKDWALARHRALTVRTLHTGKNKWDFATGIEALLVEIENGAWLIPNDGGTVDPNVNEWIRQCLFFTRNRKEHTGDVLISSWVALTGARKSGFLRHGIPLGPNPDPGAPPDNSIARLMAR